MSTVNGFAVTPTAPSASARGSATARDPTSDAQRRAWQREMERAQSEAWFKGPQAPKSATGADPTPPSGLESAAAESQLQGRSDRMFSPVVDNTVRDRSATADVDNDASTRPEGASAHGVDASSDREPTKADDRAANTASERGARAGNDAGSTQRRGASPGRSQAAGSAEAARDAAARPTAMNEAGLEAAATSSAEPPGNLSARLATATSSRHQALEPLPASALAATMRGADPQDPAAVTAPADASPPLSADASEPVDAGSARASATLAGVASAALDAIAPTSLVRLHAEWTANGLTLYIGLDASAAAQLPQLVATLSRWIARHGWRLREVVCNGACWTGSATATATGVPREAGPNTATSSPPSPSHVRATHLPAAVALDVGIDVTFERNT